MPALRAGIVSLQLNVVAAAVAVVVAAFAAAWMPAHAAVHTTPQASSTQPNTSQLPTPLGKPAPRTPPLSTTTSFSYSPAGVIAWPARVTLTATVLDQNNTPVTHGTVVFCTNLQLCTAAIASGPKGILGTAQLTAAGTASIQVFLAPATYSSLVAIYQGTNADKSSVSATLVSPLVVSGRTPTAAALTASGAPGNYTLTTTVTGGGYVPPSGTLLFLDTSYANATIGSLPLNTAHAIPQFLLASSPVTNVGPHSVSVADFNGDGYPDIAEVNYGDINTGNGNTVSILLGNGTGVYTVASTITVGSGASAITTGDFNNDGIPDLAVTNYNDTDITILLGNGNGTFTAQTTLPPTGLGPWSILTADVNNDGNLDLVVSNSTDNGPPGNFVGSVSVLLGDGTGNFTLASKPTVGETPVESAVGDFNRDGNLDIAVANQDSNSITLLFGDGTGNFPTNSTLVAGNEPVTVTVSDFNLDGLLDLAAGNNVDNTASVWLGNGAGGFTPVPNSPFPAGQGPQTARVGDFNNDGLPDLVVSDGSGNNFTILLGDGTGNFTPLSSPAPTGTEPYYFAAADFNGDGMTDLVSADLGAASLTVLLGQWSNTAIANNITVTATGTHLVDASYPGDLTHLPSLSGTVALLGTESTTTTSILGSPASGVYAGQTVQLTAQFMPISFYSFTATGTLSFYDGTSLLATLPVSSVGTATFTTLPLAAGLHSFTAVYSGDANFSTSTSPALTYNVLASFISLSATPTTFTVQQGFATAPSTLSLTTIGYNGSYTLQCSGAPQYSLCEFAPAPLIVTADGTHQDFFSLQTSGYSWTLPTGAQLPLWPAALLAAWLYLCRRKSMRRFSGLLSLLLLIAVFAATLGCSSIQPKFTPVGTYTVNVTLTGNGFSQTIPYTITVVPLQ